MNNLTEAFAHYTECQLATLENLRARKRFPASELSRHERLADGMVAECKAHGVDPGRRNTRLARRLQELEGSAPPPAAEPDQVGEAHPPAPPASDPAEPGEPNVYFAGLNVERSSLSYVAGSAIYQVEPNPTGPPSTVEELPVLWLIYPKSKAPTLSLDIYFSKPTPKTVRQTVRAHLTRMAGEAFGIC